MKHIGIIGSFGSGNLGDEAAWISFKRFLISKDPRYKYHTHIFQWSMPYQTCGYHTNPIYTLTHKELDWINENFEAMIIIGGGIIGWKWGLTKTGGIDKVINGLKIPLYSISISAEKGVYDEVTKSNIKVIMDKSKIFTVRDTYSQENVFNITGIKPDITPDIVTILGEHEYPIDADKVDKLKDTLMINASNCLLPEVIDKWKYIFQNLGGQDKVSCISFIPNQNDILLSMMTSNNDRFDFYQPEEMLTIMKGKKFIIAGRLHAAVFASTMKIPFFAINYHPKVKAFCDSINYPYYYPKTNDFPIDITEYGFDVSKFDQEELLKQIKAHMANPVKPKDYQTAMVICEIVYASIKGISFQQNVKKSTLIPCMYCGEDIELNESFVKCKHCKNVNQNDEQKQNKT